MIADAPEPAEQLFVAFAVAVPVGFSAVAVPGGSSAVATGTDAALPRNSSDCAASVAFDEFAADDTWQ